MTQPPFAGTETAGGLGPAVWALLTDALEFYRDSRSATDRLMHQVNRWGEPLRVAVAGRTRTGKSTLVNALVGDSVAPVEMPDGGRPAVWYQDGPSPRAVGYSGRGTPRELAVSRAPAGLRIGGTPERVDDLVVHWPSRTLRHVTIVDMPAIDDVDASITDKLLRDFDAMVYLTSNTGPADIEFLHTVHDGLVARAAPVGVVLVLSRADEIGGSRIDAFVSARQLARRHGREPAIRPLCLKVIAVGGLVAAASRMLGDRDFEALELIAGAPRGVVDGSLVSVDRFIAGALPVDAELRSGLLQRWGLFGIRLATTLIRTGRSGRADLAAELSRRSGLSELRETLSRGLIDRADALKARSALIAIESVLRAEPRPGTQLLQARLEEILAGAHDFRELRLTAALPGFTQRFAEPLEAEAHRLAGGNGPGLLARLGIDHRPDVHELREQCIDSLVRWQAVLANPAPTLEQHRAAAVVVQSCMAILGRLTAAENAPPS